MDAIRQDISGEIVLMVGVDRGHLEALKGQEEERRVSEKEMDLAVLAEREKGRVSGAKESSAASQEKDVKEE